MNNKNITTFIIESNKNNMTFITWWFIPYSLLKKIKNQIKQDIYKDGLGRDQLPQNKLNSCQELTQSWRLHKITSGYSSTFNSWASW